MGKHLHNWFRHFQALFLTRCSDGEQFISTAEPGSTAEWCDVDGKFAIVVHGWTETCYGSSYSTLIANLQRVRGGCILCMDYRDYSITIDYAGLVKNYEGIESVLVDKLTQLKDEGFQPNKGYMYGFSFGAHLVINSAILVFAYRSFGMIDGNFVETTRNEGYKSSSVHF
jgi:hypothetical protein